MVIFYLYFQAIAERADEETETLLVEIDCLTSQVMRETSLWNLQNVAERTCEDETNLDYETMKSSY